MFGIAKQKDTRMTATTTAPVRPADRPPPPPLDSSVVRLRELIAELADDDLPAAEELESEVLNLIRELRLRPVATQTDGAAVPADWLLNPRPVDRRQECHAVLAELTAAWRDVGRSEAREAQFDRTGHGLRRIAIEAELAKAQEVVVQIKGRLGALTADENLHAVVGVAIENRKKENPVLFADRYHVRW